MGGDMSEIEDLKARVKEALEMLPTRVEWIERRGEINIFREANIGEKSRVYITEYHLGPDDWGLFGTMDRAMEALRPIAQQYRCDLHPAPDDSIRFRKTS
jgi:hypothetical protein